MSTQLTEKDGPVLDFSGGVGNTVIMLASTGISQERQNVAKTCTVSEYIAEVQKRQPGYTIDGQKKKLRMFKNTWEPDQLIYASLL